MTSAPQSDDSPPGDIDSLQADIEDTREQLGQTVDALTAKLDVKTRARHRLDASVRQARVHVGTARAHAVELTNTTRNKVSDEDGDVRRETVLAAAVLTLSLGAVLVLAARRWHR